MAKAKADIRSLARSHTETAIRVLAGIMREKDSPPAARVSAAQALLDRGWGKPQQSVHHSGELTLSGLYETLGAAQTGLPSEDEQETRH